MEKKNFIVVGANPEQQQKIDCFFQDGKFAVLKNYLQANDLLDEQTQTNLIKECLLGNSTQFEGVLSELRFSEQDLNNIACLGSKDCFWFALKEAEDYQKPMLAVALLTQPEVTDIFPKLKSVVLQNAYSRQFWDIMLSEKKYGLLSEAVREMIIWQRLPEYQNELLWLENKILSRNIESELIRIAPALSLSGWKRLTSDQVAVCSRYVCPPESFFRWCVNERETEKIVAAAENLALEPPIMKQIIMSGAIDIFAEVIKKPKQDVYGEARELLFVRKYRKFYKEYAKYRRFSFWERMFHFCSF